MNKIPVVFAFDDNYALPGSVAIMSLIENAAPDTFYDVFVMCSDDLNVGNRELNLRHIERLYHGKASLSFIDVGNYFEDAPLTFHFTRTAYYRLLIHKYLTEYDKVIWCDVDVLFRGDFSGLYELDISNYYLGACISAIAIKNPDQCNFKGNTYSHDFFSSGVSLLNLKRFRTENIEEKFFEVLEKHGENLLFLDQDILNEVCGCSYLKIPIRYNLFRDIHKHQFKESYSRQFKGIFSKEDLKTEFDNAVVSHYEGSAGKPWSKTGFVKEWYLYAFRSAFPEKALLSYKENKPKFVTISKRFFRSFRKWMFQVKLKRGKRVFRLFGIYLLNERD